MSSQALTLDPAPPAASGESGTATLLVCLTAPAPESLQGIRARLLAAHPGVKLLLAVPDGEGALGGDIPILSFPIPSRTHPAWVLTAGDYGAAAALAREHDATATLVLGSDAENLSMSALQALSQGALNNQADVLFPRYTLNPHEGLVSAALLYPLTHTLFGTPVHLPLPLDLAFTARAASHLGVAARRHTNNGVSEALLWPAAEASVSNLRVAEVNAGPHSLSPPADIDLNSLLAQVLGSAFTDIESKAAFWQRARILGAAVSNLAPQTSSALISNVDLEEIAPMVDAFRNAFNNLQQIWALVLPPHSLLALKKLSNTPSASFRMPPGLWARTVYEFVLAFHLRTLNRGHLLGALTPLYLAWIASYLGQVGNDPEAAAAFNEQTAQVFLAEKPYLVSRWRWPDRFNP